MLSYKIEKARLANTCMRKHPTSGGITAHVQPSYGRHQLAAIDPRADADVAEPPVIVIRKTHRRRLCKAALLKATLDDSRRSRTFYKADRVRGPASNRVA